MSKKDEILKRAKLRKDKITVKKTDMKLDENSSLLTSLSFMELWEMTAKISKENYFLETGIKPSNRVDKSKFKCI